MRLRFWKMTGAGNDFVLLAGLPKGRTGHALARVLCDRRFGVGADGLLVLSRNKKAVRLDYWNADGSAAFCGNGSRCAALWAAEHGWVRGKSFVLASNRGPLQVVLTGKGRAQVKMPSPHSLVLGKRLALNGKKLAVHYVDTGVPHAVVFVNDITKTNVKELGKALRFHKAFGKNGANVDFVQFKAGVAHLRTYERGVEDETLACGTGVVAAAFVARALGLAGSPVAVKVRGGATLTVSFDDGARLEGPGLTVYSGETTI